MKKINNGLIDKNIITVSLSATVNNISVNNYYPNFDVSEVVGNKLSLSSGSVLIGAGVSKVKVSATTFINTTNTNGYLWLFVMKNTSTVAGAIHQNNTPHAYTSCSISERVISVSEGDTLNLRYDVTHTMPFDIRGGRATWLTVEVVE